MTTTQYQVLSKDLHLIKVEVSSTPTKAVSEPVPLNHVALIDISGSMCGELPQIRKDLKAKLPKLLGPKDTFSLVGFSGRGQVRVILEGEPIRDLKDLLQVDQAIDKWLQIIGSTGFKEPLEEVTKLATRLAKKNDYPLALFFMSDGCDNEWPRNQVVAAAEAAGKVVASATFVEYGYYVDRPLLTQMAEKAGGSLIFAKTFSEYAPAFESSLQRKVVGSKKVEVALKGDPIGGFAFALHHGEILTFGVKGSKVTVPEEVEAVYYLNMTSVGSMCKADQIGGIYAAMALFGNRMNSLVVLKLLQATGDVRLIDQFSTCFGKQRYAAFVDLAKTAAFDPKERYKEGRDLARVPKEDAFTVLDLLTILSKDPDSRVLLHHPSFQYQRIGRGTVDASEVLTAEEQTEVKTLTDQISKTKDPKKIAGLTQRLTEITNKKGHGLKFAEASDGAGYPVRSLVYNEERPNISISVKKPGSVRIAGSVPKELAKTLPDEFPTFQFRSYTLVKDGIVNVPVLPVTLSKATHAELDKLTKAGQIPAGIVTTGPDGVVLIALDKLPVINRQMVKAVRAKDLFELEYRLTKARAAQKVYNSVLKEVFPDAGKKSVGFETQYGKQAAEWLKEAGFTDYSGFNPKVVQADATDFYMSKELAVSLKGYSTLPSLKDLRAKMAKGKLNGPAELMRPALESVDKFMATKEYTSAKDPIQALEAWIDTKVDEATTEVRACLIEKAGIVSSIILGQIWFQEFQSLDENTLTITVDGVSLEGKVEMVEKKVQV